MKTDTITNRPSPTTPAYALQPVASPEAWQHTLAGLPNAHVLQSWAWGAFKSRWGWTPQHFALQPTPAGANTPPLAALQVLKRKLPRLPFNMLYLPRGPVFDHDDSAVRQMLLHQLEQLARQERAIFIKIDPEVVSGWDEVPVRPAPAGQQFMAELKARGWRYANDQVQFRNTVLLDLTRPEDDILAAMKQKTRYNIRLAGRKGVVTRPGTSEDFPTIASMYKETAGRDDFAIRPATYYLDAWQTLYDAGLAYPFIAEFNGQPIAAIIVVRSGRRAIYMYGASLNEERQRMPNHLLQWDAIRWARSAGCTTYDFWGAPDEFVESDRLWGVWRFKAGFNGQITRHIGAWDYPARPGLYWLFTTLMPRYLNLLRARARQA